MLTGRNNSASVAVPYMVAPGASGARPDRHVATDATRLDLQRLIADLADQLTVVPPESIDVTIAEGLRGFADALQCEQAALWRADDTDTAATFTATRQNEPLREPLRLPSLGFFAAALRSGSITCLGHPDEIPDPVDRMSVLRQGVRSAVIIPLAKGSTGDERRALAFATSASGYEWTPAIIEQLRIVAGLFALGLERKASHDGVSRTALTVEPLGEPLAAPHDEYRPGGAGRCSSRLIVSSSAAVRQAVAQAEQVAPTSATVLLVGETGVGKEVFARMIHDLSPRHHRALIRVNCAALPSALIESELFGRERGAYTGAIAQQIGRFEAANHSTIFLDEIGELPAEVQVKLLSVLQERVIERLGSTRSIKLDVRVIAATNRNLEKAVQDKSFREDLFYRLNVFPIAVPPLRKRIEDIPALVWQFIDEFSTSFGKKIESVSRESMQQLEQYGWPGNVRELRNVIERAVILATQPRLTVPMPQPAGPCPPTLATLELEHIRTTLERTNWRIRGEGGAAERLGLKPTTLESRLAKLGLVRPDATRRNPTPSVSSGT